MYDLHDLVQKPQDHVQELQWDYERKSYYDIIKCDS